HTLRDVDAVADDVVLAVDVLCQVHRAQIDAHAHRQLAHVVENGDRRKQRALRIVEEGNGRAVAGIDHHAIARLEIGERSGQHLVELLLKADLLAHAAPRIAGDVDEQHAADQRAARPFSLRRQRIAHRMPGIMPFMPRIIRCRLPPFIIFIIFCICSNWLSSWFTACTGTPAPAAMRRLREALISSGLARSARVIELMMPSMRLSCLSSASFAGSTAPTSCAGSLSMSEATPPIFFICAICCLKSSRSKPLPFFTFSATRLASSRSILACASSTRDRMSPMPRMRAAMRSGWNGSRPESFSPTPANLIGLPVTWR